MNLPKSLIPRKAGQELLHLTLLAASVGLMVWWWSIGPEEARCWGIPVEIEGAQ